MEKNKNLGLDTIIEQIYQADKLELDAMEQAIIFRYRDLFPDWEIISLSLPKNDLDGRKRILDFVFKTLEKEAVAQ